MVTGVFQGLLDAKSIAIYGASSRPGSPGHRVLSYLQEYEFAGRIVLVNPRYEDIEGMPCIPDLDHLAGDPPDHALLLVSPGVLPAAIRDCGRNGVRTISVLAAGFSEIDGDGDRIQQELAELAAGFGMRMLGPNCLGAVNAHTGLIATTATAFESTKIKRGAVSIVTQSGAVGAYLAILLARRGIGLRYLVSTGNEADIGLGELLAEVATDPATETIVAYVEGVRDGAHFLEGLRTARRSGKQVVVVKVGRTELGAQAVRSHTAALAGDDAVFGQVLRRMGAIRAASVSEVVDVVQVAGERPLPAGANRVGIVTVSGGLGAMASEVLADYGFELPPLPAEVQRRMRELIPYCVPVNPVDATGQITTEPAKLRDFISLTVESGVVDAIVVLLAYAGLSANFAVLKSGAVEAARRTDLPVFLVGSFSPGDAAELRNVGVIPVDEVVEVARRLDVMRRLTQARKAPADVAAVPQLPSGPAQAETEVLEEGQAMALLGAVGIPFVDWSVQESPDAVMRAADRLGYPVAVKRLVAGVMHKSDLGLVALGLEDAAAVLDAVTGMAVEGPSGGRFLIQRMAEGRRHELIVAAWRDPVFGPVFMVGMGGLFAELHHDRAIVLPPFDEPAVLEALRSLRGFPLLLGARGQEPADMAEVAHVLMGMAKLMKNAPEVQEVEVNPLLVGVAGAGALAVDAMVRVSRAAKSRPAA